MKVFSAVVAVLAGLTTLVSAIATPQETDVGEFAGASFVLDKLPDGRRRVSLFNDGAFAGSVTEGGPGSTDNLIVADATNTTVSAAGLDAVQVADAVNWGPAIAKLGPRFIPFIDCVGREAAALCAARILACVVTRRPWVCLGGIYCAGKYFRQCA